MNNEMTPTASTLKKAERTIQYHAAAAAAALLLPVPYIDPLLLLGVQVNLVRSLAKIYNLPFSENVGKSLVSALVGISLSGAAWSMLKFIPFLGMVTASAAGAASTYAVGKVFIQHFESGGTFLTFDPEKVKEHYQREFAKASGARQKYVDDEVDFGGIKP